MLDKGYGMIPNKILFDTELTDKQKLLFCLISSLCAKEGFCWATNDYLGEKLGTNKLTISRNIAVLEGKGLIYTDIISEQGNKRKMGIVKNDNTYGQKSIEGIDKNVNSLYIYMNITNEYIYERYYGATKGINKKKCNGIIDGLLKQGVTLNDIYTGMVLYNNECRLNKEWRYVRKLENWLDEFQPLNEDQIEETLTRIIREHKLKKKSDEKYSKSAKAKTLWNELCETFGKERVNTIFKNEAVGGIELNFI